MVNPVPNRALVNSLEAAHTAKQVADLIDGECIIDVIQYVMGEYKDARDKACIIEFSLRHGGLTMKNLRRYFGSGFFAQKTNRCSKCRRIGHQAKYCQW